MRRFTQTLVVLLLSALTAACTTSAQTGDYIPYKKPYSMSPTTSSVKVLWQMAEETCPTEAVVRYGTSPDSLNQEVTTSDGWMVEGEGFMRMNIGTNPTVIFSKPGCHEAILDQLAKVEHVQVWEHGKVPEHLRYGTSPRLGDIIVAPDLGWQFSRTPRGMLGAHGYDPEEPDMQVIFRACGPDFKRGFICPETFVNVDVYPLLAHLLQLVPVSTDGDFSRVAPLLVK